MAENHALLFEGNMYTKPDALQEVKDMSKNLMSGDFERQYSGTMVQKCDRRKHVWKFGLAAAVGALAVWLLMITILREVQLGHLRKEVDELTANMIAMSANVKSLNQKIDNNKLLNEFKELEDTIYADEEQDISLPSITEEKYSDKDSLEKLHGLTVLEDESLGDDEDLFDVDDAESGDWYPDYDRRREKIGTTTMVRLKPEDFTDSVLTFEKDGEKLLSNDIRELKRLINNNPENPDIPELRTMLPTRPVMVDPLPSEPASDASAPTQSNAGARDKRSVLSDSTIDAIDSFAAPKIMTKSEERRKVKKYSSNIEQAPAKMSLHTVTRTARNSDTEEGQRRPFIAAHFHGNTSHLSPEIHEHYKGNGLVRVSHGAAHDVWYPAPWTVASPHPRPTLTRNGHVHVHHTGVYLVYVQIYYLDSHDIISWVLHRTNADIEGRQTLLQCAQSAHSAEPQEKPNSCFSAAALFLKAGDRLAVRNTGGDRHSLMQPEKSFIGLVKLADAEDPTQEL